MDILSDNEDKCAHRPLKINEKYAREYHERKRQEDLKCAVAAHSDDDGASSSSSEDEYGNLLNSSIEDGDLFTDEDFDAKPDEDESKTKDVKKKIQYADIVRDALLKDGAEAAFDENHETSKDSDANALNEFLKAANCEDDDNDIFCSKAPKGEEEQKDENDKFETFLKRRRLKRTQKEMSQIETYWNNNQVDDMDEDERFLRDFVINRRWLERDNIQRKTFNDTREDEYLEPGSDDENKASPEKAEDFEDENEDFERSYNFRFEEDGGNKIMTYSRNIENSVRQKDPKRKRARDAKSERSTLEKNERVEELKRLKRIKREEIEKRLNTIRKVGGVVEGEKEEEKETKRTKILDSVFNPDTHDEEVEAILGTSYYEQTETMDTKELLTDIPDGHDDVLKTEEHQWFLCDSCKYPIPAHAFRFECRVCPQEFILCYDCYKQPVNSARHKHKMRRLKVEAANAPPTDVELNKPYLEDDAVCEDPSENQDLNKLLDSYLELDYEDVIGDGVKTRFKYSKVKPSSYSLTSDELLKAPDRELNRKISMKRIATYRNNREEKNYKRKMFVNKLSNWNKK